MRPGACLALLALVIAGLPAVAQEKPAPPGRLAFTREGNLWTIQADGTGERALTRDPPSGDRPLAWSPDGRRILFWKHSAVGWDVWSLDVERGTTANLTRTTSGGCRSAAWSPDGTRIAFMRDDPAGLYVMDADGGNARRLTGRGHRDDRPAWSPDGKRLVTLHPAGR